MIQEHTVTNRSRDLMQRGFVELAVRDGVRPDKRLQADALLHPFHRGDILPLHMHRIHRRCTEGKKKD
jgi:hypothetical protein